MKHIYEGELHIVLQPADAGGLRITVEQTEKTDE